MKRRIFLFLGYLCLFSAWSAKADDLRNQIDILLKGKGKIMWAAKSPAENTQVYYFQDSASKEIFPITCTLLLEGGSFCTRGAAAPGGFTPFVVPKAQ